jgi:hypothetical protein
VESSELYHDVVDPLAHSERVGGEIGRHSSHTGDFVNKRSNVGCIRIELGGSCATDSQRATQEKE